MEQIFETLRVSTDNDARKSASAHLRHIQESNPEEFLSYTFSCVTAQQAAPELRFFTATIVLSFVEDSWHNSVNKELQEAYLSKYVAFVLSEYFSSALLARKVATIIAVMARRSSIRAQLGRLPPLIEHAAAAYTECLSTRCVRDGALVPGAEPLLSQVLLLIHILLKETQTKRIGNAFELLSAGLVAPLSSVFTAIAPYDPLSQYEVYLFLFKCALRVFGRGVFDPAFYRFLLSATWGLTDGFASAAGDSAVRQKRARLVDYGVKIHENVVTYFPSQLHELGQSFFLSGAERSLFGLLHAVIETGAAAGSRASGSSESPIMEKTVCRAMRLLTCFVTAEDGDEFIAGCVAAVGAAETMPSLVSSVITGFLQDSTDAEALEEWRSDPEKVAADLDVDLDDDSPASCAEQLFLALTGSTVAAEKVLAAAWDIVNRLLSAGGEGEVTAALHAIGIGYYTMASGTSRESYLSFLQGKLLPMIRAAGAEGGGATPTVLRRVVWLIGMWCESVEEASIRAEVHVALHGFLLKHSDNTVLVLTALRAVENFFTDNHFTTAETTPEYLQILLAAVQHVLTCLKHPVTVRQMACLVSTMTAKGMISSDADHLLAAFATATVAFMARCEAEFMGSGGPAGASDGFDDDDADEGQEINMGVLPLLLEALGNLVKASSNDAAAWQLFPGIIVGCTEVGRSITPWAEDGAWELLLTIAQSTTFHRFASLDAAAATHAHATAALAHCRAHMQRDFESLGTAVRSAAALVVLLAESEEIRRMSAAAYAAAHASSSGGAVCSQPALPVTEAEVQRVFTALVETSVEELSSACCALLIALVVTEPASVAPVVFQRSVAALASTSDIQAESSGVSLAVLLSAAALSEAGGAGALMGSFITGQITSPSTVLENLVLVLDVCPNRLAERCVARLLAAWREGTTAGSIPVPGDVGAMVDRAVEGALAAPPIPPPGSAAGGWQGGDDDGEEVRPADELLLELLGDETAEPGSMHVKRVVGLYAPLFGYL